jgi:Domain of unknown function (DUF6378)
MLRVLVLSVDTKDTDMDDFNSITSPPKSPRPTHLHILDEATRSITDHMVDYGEPAANYERASALVSLILNKPITPYEITMIKLAVKLSRIAETPDLRKAYIEMIACAALAGEFVNAGHITTKRMASMLKPDHPTVKAPDPLSMPRTRALVEIEDR